MSAAALNEAMASLGIAGIHFSMVEGDHWRVGIGHDMPIAELIRLLLANLSAVHVHRQEQTALLDELVSLLDGQTPTDDPRVTAILNELRRTVCRPLLAPGGTTAHFGEWQR